MQIEDDGVMDKDSLFTILLERLNHFADKWEAKFSDMDKRIANMEISIKIIGVALTILATAVVSTLMDYLLT